MYPPFDVMQLLLTAHPDGEKDEREGFTAAVHYAVEKCDNCGVTLLALTAHPGDVKDVSKGSTIDLGFCA